MSEMHPRSIVAVGITNQRETLVMWDRRTGEPVANAIVWQCRRSAPICERLKSEGLEDTIRSKTGLPIDPYFTGTKIRWLLDNIPDGQRRAERGDLACGTVDSWLVWNLTNKLVHATDATNASRTMLFDIDAMRWDPELLSALEVPAAILPEVRTSSEIYGYVSGDLSAGQPIPIAGIAGDQQAVAFRTGLLRASVGQEHLRDRLFCAHQHRDAQSRVHRRSGLHGGMDARRRDDLRARRQHILGWLYHPVAPRRPRPDFNSGRVRGSRSAGARQRRRVPRSGLLGTRRSLLGHVRARRCRGLERGNDAGAHRQGCPGVDCLPDAGRAGRDAARRRTRSRIAQGRWRRDGQRLSHAVPGGHTWDSMRSNAQL